jgi:hypothetical protein
MHGIAPSEKDTDNAALEKRLWDAAHQFRANSGLKSQEYSAPVLGLIFLRFAEVRFAAQRAKQLALVSALLLLFCGCSSTAPQSTPGAIYNVQDLGMVTGVIPLVVQPDHAKWRQLQVGMTEGEVSALLGNPYRKDPRPAVDTEPG